MSKSSKKQTSEVVGKSSKKATREGETAVVKAAAVAKPVTEHKKLSKEEKKAHKKEAKKALKEEKKRAKEAKKVQKQAESDDSSEDEAAAKKAPTPASSESSDSETEKAVTKAAVTENKNAASSSDEDSSDEEGPKKQAAASDSDSSSDSEDEKAQPTAAPSSSESESEQKNSKKRPMPEAVATTDTSSAPSFKKAKKGGNDDNEDWTSNMVFVQGLEFHTSAEALTEWFTEAGPIKRIRWHMADHGKAFVQFEDEEAAARAVAMSGRTGPGSRGRFINVYEHRPSRWFNPSAVFVVGATPDYESQMRTAFGAFGTISEIQFHQDNGNTNGLVIFEHPSEADACVAADFEIEGTRVQCRLASAKYCYGLDSGNNREGGHREGGHRDGGNFRGGRGGSPGGRGGNFRGGRGGNGRGGNFRGGNRGRGRY